ncbi:MAG: exosortase A [Aquincola tertiaricarbonis]
MTTRQPAMSPAPMLADGPRTAAGWREAAPAMAAYLLLVLLAYRGTALSMVDIWERSATFTHCFLVPPLVGWLVWRQRALLRQLTPVAVPAMVPVLGALAVAWWLGELADVNAVTQLAFVALLAAGVPTLLGWQVTRALLFPLAFLFFAVPLGEFMTPALMQHTADFTVATLRLSGIPVYREGLQFVIPSGRWSVVEACSGIRYLMASFMVGSLFAYLNYRSLSRRLVFCLLSLVVPVLANWLRAYLIVLVGHLSNNQIATGVDHLVYGWVFFGIVITALFFIGARWSEPDAAVPERVQALGRAGRASAGRLLVVALCAAVAVSWPAWLRPADGQPGAALALSLPAPAAPDWQAADAPLSDWRPAVVGARAEQSRTYDGPAGRVGLHVAYYRQQQEGSKAVSSVNALLRVGDTQRHAVTVGPVQAPGAVGVAGWQATELRGSSIATAQQQPPLLVWRTYWIGGQLVGNEVQAKLRQAWMRVRGEPDDAAIVLIYTEATADDQAARRLQAFAAAHQDTLLRALDDARRAR